MTAPMSRPFELRAIELRPQSLALTAPLVTGRGTYRRRRLTVLRVEIRIDGSHAHGFGEVSALPGWSEQTPEALDAAARRIGCPAVFASVDELDAVLPEAVRLRPLRFGLECALLDALCRHAGCALSSALAERRGGVALASVPVQITLGDADADSLVERLRRAREAGFECAKLKVGARETADDVVRIRAVADADHGLSLRLDANGAWSVPDALRVLAALPAEAIEMVEQPVADDQIETLFERYDGSGPRIAIDESVAVPGRAKQLLERTQLRAIVVKPAALGGLLRADALFDIALAHGASVIVSNLMESAVGRRAVAQLVAARPDLPGPHGLATGDWFARDLAEPDVIENGRLTLPGGAGIGPAFGLP